MQAIRLILLILGAVAAAVVAFRVCKSVLQQPWAQRLEPSPMRDRLAVTIFAAVLCAYFLVAYAILY